MLLGVPIMLTDAQQKARSRITKNTHKDNVPVARSFGSKIGMFIIRLAICGVFTLVSYLIAQANGCEHYVAFVPVPR